MDNKQYNLHPHNDESCLYKVCFFDKLVRDNIIDQIVAKNCKPNNKVYDIKYHTVQAGEFAVYLRRKVIEELREIQDARGLNYQMKEMADVFTVLLELATIYQINWSDLSNMEPTNKINIYNLINKSQMLLRSQKYSDIVNTLQQLILDFITYVQSKSKNFSINSLWSLINDKNKKSGAFSKKIVLSYIVISDQHDYFELYKTKYKVEPIKDNTNQLEKSQKT